MKRFFVSVVALPIAILCGCGSPLVWRGPSGTSDQELADVQRRCLTQAQARRTLDAQVYDQSVMQPSDPATRRAAATAEPYRSADQVFEQCMREQGYALVPQG